MFNVKIYISQNYSLNFYLGVSYFLENFNFM